MALKEKEIEFNEGEVELIKQIIRDNKKLLVDTKVAIIHNQKAVSVQGLDEEVKERFEKILKQQFHNLVSITERLKLMEAIIKDYETRGKV